MKTSNLVKNNPYLFLSNGILNFLSQKKSIVDKSVYETIRLCQEPQDINVLLNKNKIPSSVIDLLLKYEIIIPFDMLWKQVDYTKLDIEICTHCNFRCEYCPVKDNPKAPQFMDNELFSEIIDKVKNYPSINTIVLNSYNEPLLDPGLLAKLNLISGINKKVNLFTNGSLLLPDILDAILKLNVIDKFYFNLPASDEESYREKTGSRLFNTTINNLEYAIKQNADITLIILDKKLKQNKAYDEYYNRYHQYPNVKIMSGLINDRAGSIQNKYSQHMKIEGKLSGCMKIINSLVISVNGDFFICCQDYNQKEIYGNIRDGEIADIIHSEQAINLRKKVFGELESDPDFICRKCYDMHEFNITSKMNNLRIFNKTE